MHRKQEFVANNMGYRRGDSAGIKDDIGTLQPPGFPAGVSSRHAREASRGLNRLLLYKQAE